MTWLVAAIAAIAAAVLGAAAAPAGAAPPLGLGRCAPAQGVVRCDGLVPTWDGVPLDTTVVLPRADARGLPLAVLVHGFGNSKEEYLDPAETAYTGNAYAWARRGYAVLAVTARGLWGSCGTPESRPAGGAACARGWIHLADVRYEVRDLQELIGRLVDGGFADPARIGVTGDSYGGGQTSMLAVLRDRVMLPDGRLVAWRSPRGVPLRLAAAAPVIPWTNLVGAIAPNGHDTTDPVGVFKATFANAIFAAAQLATGPGQPAGQPFVPGRPEGYLAPPGVDPDADVGRWVGRADAGEPYDDAEARAIVDTLQRFHSAVGIDGSSPPPPLLVASGITDDLFPVQEGQRLIERTRREHPAVPTSLFIGDFGHQRAANKPADRRRLVDAIAAWFDRYVRGDGPRPAEGVVALTQTCPRDRPSEGPFAAPTLGALADDVLVLRSAEPQVVSSAGGDPATGRALDPAAGGGDGCAEVGARDAPGTAVYRLPAAGALLLGAPRVTARLAVSGAAPGDTQLAARLWDVAPGGTTQRLVARGVVRPTGQAHDTLPLAVTGWRFGAGHVARLELLGNDAPFGRPSNSPFQITVSDLELRLPVRRAGPSAPASAAPVRCASRRRFALHVRPGLRAVRVTVDGRRVRVRRRRAVVDLRGKPRKTVRVVITGRTRSGRHVRDVRRYRTCRPGRHT